MTWSRISRVRTLLSRSEASTRLGITANYENIDATLRDRYYKQVIAAGGTPVIIPSCTADSNKYRQYPEHLDGLILTGGGDHNPSWMGEEPSPVFIVINQSVMRPS